MKILSKLSLPQIFVLIFLFVHILLLGKLIFFPYPELFIYPYLTNNGLLPYKQILDQHFPGLMFFPINLDNLGMNTPADARVWQFGLISLNHILIFLVGKKLFNSERWALGGNLLYLLWQPFFEGWVLWIDSFVPALLLATFLFLLRKHKKKTLFIAGIFVGVALLFKQVVGPLIALLFIYLLIRYRRIKEPLYFSLGVAIPVALLLTFIFSRGIFKDFWYWAVTFNLTVFAEMGRKFPDTVGLVKSLPFFGASFLASLYLIIKKRKDSLLLFLFLFGSLSFAYARFDFIHLQPAIPFGLLTLVYFAKEFKKWVLSGGLLYLILSLFILIPFYRSHAGDRVLFFGQEEKKIEAFVEEKTEPGDTVFAFATTPHVYQMTNTLPPGKVFVFQFPWFMKVVEDKVLSGIINDPPKVVLRDENATTGGERLISYMTKIQEYLEENYKVVDRVGNTQLMLKR